MLRVDLIGPGDAEFHYKELLRINNDKLNNEIEKIAKALHSTGIEIALLPDKGICIKLAKRFKELGGNVIGLVPQQDKTFGISHLQKYIDTKVKGKELFDKIIDTGDWFRHDLTKCLFGDVVLCLGISPGTEGERAYGIYLYKIVAGYKHGVNTDIRKIHSEAKAGTQIPYTIFLYKPFLKSGKVSFEEEEYAKRFGIKLVYIENSKELEKKLRELNKSS